MTNKAYDYGVTVVPAWGAPAWRVLRVRRLSPTENNGKHHVFVKVLAPDGSRDRNPALRLGWGWENRRIDENAPPVPLDKPDVGELGHGNVPINAHQKIVVWIEGDGLPSDRVLGLRTDFPDEAPGNTWGHYSYEVIFQRQTMVPVEPPVVEPVVVGEGPAEPGELTLAAQVAQLVLDVAELKAWRATIEGDGR